MNWTFYGEKGLSEPNQSPSCKTADSYAKEKSHIAGLLRTFLFSRRLRPLLILAGVSYLLFIGFRIALLLASLKYIPDSSFGEIARCLVVAFGFDGMTVGYLLIPLVALLSLSAAATFEKKWFRRTVGAYVSAATSYILLIEIVGMIYFLYSGTRINWRLPYYIRYSHEVLGHVWSEYPLWAMLPLLPLGYWIVYRLYAKVLWHGSKPIAELHGWKKWALAAVLAGVCVLACRGGFGHRPLNSSELYSNTSNQLLAELSKNNSQTLYSGAKHLFDEGQDEKGIFGLLDIEDAQPIVTQMLYQKQDTPLQVKGNPLWRRTDTGLPVKKHNVVVIIMESMAGKYVGSLGYEQSLTPNLDAICKQGLYFSRFYAVGARTSRGMVGTLCGHPDLCWRTVLDRQLAVGNFLTLPAIFKDRGYRTLFLYGGKPSFDNMGPFFSAGGIETIFDEDDMNAKESSTWGVPDEYLFNKSIKVFDDLGRKGQAFFSVLLTISNHDPFDVPSGRVKMLSTEIPENKIINATRYSDWALGEFFRQARTKPWFSNTVFVLVADTGRVLAFDKTRILDAVHYRIPCVFYAPGIIKPGKLDTVASQTDIAPTLLAMLGGQYEHCFLGRNILAVEPGDGFALLHEDDRLAFIRNESLLTQPPRSKPILYDLGMFNMKINQATPSSQPGSDKITSRLHDEMSSLYQMARHLYVTGQYKHPEKPLHIVSRKDGK